MVILHQRIIASSSSNNDINFPTTRYFPRSLHPCHREDNRRFIWPENWLLGNSEERKSKRDRYPDCAIGTRRRAHEHHLAIRISLQECKIVRGLEWGGGRRAPGIVCSKLKIFSAKDEGYHDAMRNSRRDSFSDFFFFVILTEHHLYREESVSYYWLKCS